MSDLDEDFLASYAIERQTAAANHHTRGGDRCARCPHGWHGVACRHDSCFCASSWEVTA